MSYTPTLIRFEEEQYRRLKDEAAKNRKSLSAVVREVVNEKLGIRSNKKSSREELLKILEQTRGSWAGDDWPETEKRQRKIDLAEAKSAKESFLL